ncbi:MAG: hypothetical protein V2J24_10640 [Pseudomonadales bacterium]|jgi:hypothetical protein|nr:hypothetical protein [Pseudomonadales bacterium]
MDAATGRIDHVRMRSPRASIAGAVAVAGSLVLAAFMGTSGK